MMMRKPLLFGRQGGEEHPGQQVALQPQGRFFHGCPRLPGRLWHHLVIHHHLNPSKSSFDYLEMEYGGIRRDRMRHIPDFQMGKGNTPRIMYA